MRLLEVPLSKLSNALEFKRVGGGMLVEVWKDPSCGCCQDWLAHMQANGFELRSYDTGNVAVRQRLGVPAKLGSCHTARVDGYAIEGHVPASEVQRLLRERPPALGLVVPGMPIGSPGMDTPAYGGPATCAACAICPVCAGVSCC